jgi:hypothetical protein
MHAQPARDNALLAHVVCTWTFAPPWTLALLASLELKKDALRRM